MCDPPLDAYATRRKEHLADTQNNMQSVTVAWCVCLLNTANVFGEESITSEPEFSLKQSGGLTNLQTMPSPLAMPLAWLKCEIESKMYDCIYDGCFPYMT